MASHDAIKRALTGLLLLTALAVVTDANAQKKRLPVRTEEIPDTETGRPAASAEKPTFKGRLIIYGPPELPLGAPPEHIKPAPATEPVAAEPVPEPAPAPSASPAPVVAPAPPVATPKPAPAQIAVPAPAPAPTPSPARIAVPAPTPTPAPVAVVPVPTPSPPAPVAVPIPTAPAVRIAAPAPALTTTPAPAAAASEVREPVVRDPIVRQPVREPVVRPEPARPAAPAAAPRREIALAAPSSAPAAPVPIEAKLIESVFNCLSPGLPPDWKRAWVEITDQGGGKEKSSKFRVSNIGDINDEGAPLEPCNAQELTKRIVGLNDKLPPDRRAWTRALLVIDSDGEYELTYEFTK